MLDEVLSNDTLFAVTSLMSPIASQITNRTIV